MTLLGGRPLLTPAASKAKWPAAVSPQTRHETEADAASAPRETAGAIAVRTATDTVRNVPERRASCSCGQLQAVVTGEPVRVSICHCLACQRRTGSSYGYQARFPARSVTISGRSTQFVRHSDEEAGVRLSNFCPDCGATVFLTIGAAGEMIAIPVGAFADPGFPPPQISVWEERKHGWVVVPDEAEHIS